MNFAVSIALSATAMTTGSAMVFAALASAFNPDGWAVASAGGRLFGYALLAVFLRAAVTLLAWGYRTLPQELQPFARSGPPRGGDHS